MRWLKTEHAFPDAAVLRAYRRRLGDLLRDTESVSEQDLNQALVLQGKTGLKLGQVLSMSGLAAPRAVIDAIAEQFALPVVEPDPYRIPLLLLRRLSEPDAVVMRVLPLDIVEEDRAWVAVSELPSPATLGRLEALLKMKVSLCFVSEAKIRRARDRAYRRLVLETEGGPKRTRLGERLIAAGKISQEQLEEALQEQVQTGERLGELLLRLGWITAPVLAAAIGGSTGLPFRAVQPTEVDPVGLQRIGYGLAALYRLLPLRRRPGSSSAEVVSAAPLHGEVKQFVAARLGCPIECSLGPSLHLRLGLAIGARRAWPSGIAGGLGGMDGSELAALASDAAFGGRTESIRDQAMARGCSPIELLVLLGELDAVRAARFRARVLGVALATPAQLESVDDDAWLPPGLVRRGAVRLIDLGTDHLVVASSRPTARLAREISTLFPDAAIAWRVAPAEDLLQEPGEAADEQVGEHSTVGAPGGL